MASSGYVPSYKVHNQKSPLKKQKTLFMAPVFVKRSASDKKGILQLEPTKDKPCKSCNLPCIIPGISTTTHIPRDTYTQTSKTIIQLAHMEHFSDISRLTKMAELQETPENDKQLKGEKAERDNTLDLCPDLDLDDMELELDMDGSGDRKDYACDDRYSVDSLNTQQEPEKENPIHSAKATRDLQECIDLHDTKDLRLNQWVDNINRIDVKQEIWESSMTMPLITSRVSMNKELMGNQEYLRRKSMYSLVESPRQSFTSQHKCRCSCTASAKEIDVDVVNLPKNVASSELVRHISGKPCMTSFHNLIHLNDELLKCGGDTPLPATPPANASVTPLQNTSSSSTKKELKTWHCQVQYGRSSSEESTSGLVEHQPSTKSSHHVGSKSLAESERIFTEGGADPANRTRYRREATTGALLPSEATTTSAAAPAAGVQHPFNYQMYKKPEGGGTSFMSPTLSSERKSLKQQVESVKWVMGNKFKGSAPTPKMSSRQTDIPFTDLKTRAVKSEDLSKSASVQGIGKIPAAFSSTTLFGGSSSSCDNGFYILLNRIKSPDFNNALKSLAELIDTARHTTPEVMMPYMTLINQRLLDLLKSPRSHVARTACQLSGHCFEVMKDTRRPEFDDMINTLLYKTADASKFIRQDANMALDAMVTHIPTFHAVRAVCAKGPTHRNPLVRCASVRLIICAVVIAGATAIMNHVCHEASRKRILENIMYFISDKNGETRKYGERLFRILYKEGTFDYYAKKYLNRTKYEALMDVLKTLQKKPLETGITRDTFKS